MLAGLTLLRTSQIDQTIQILYGRPFYETYQVKFYQLIVHTKGEPSILNVYEWTCGSEETVYLRGFDLRIFFHFH